MSQCSTSVHQDVRLSWMWWCTPWMPARRQRQERVQGQCGLHSWFQDIQSSNSKGKSQLSFSPLYLSGPCIDTPFLFRERNSHSSPCGINKSHLLSIFILLSFVLKQNVYICVYMHFISPLFVFCVRD